MLLAGDTPLDGDLKVRFEFANPSGDPVETLQVSDDFLLRVYVQDIRSNPTGVLQAFFDVNYQSNLISATGDVINAPEYSFGGEGDALSTPGLIDEAGGVDLVAPGPIDAGAEFLLFTVPFQADAAGTLDLSADLSEFNPRLPLFHQDPVIIQLQDIDFICETIEIVAAGVLVTPTSGLMTTEGGAAATFDVVLSTEPTDDVTFTLASDNTNEGTLSDSTVTFTPGNWDIPQTITVTGVNDFVDDGDVVYTIMTSAASSVDSRFNNRPIADVTVTNLDDDTAGVTVSPTTGLITSEAGDSDTFQIVLTSQPTSDVTIGLTSNNTGEGTVSADELIFTPGNWDMPQTVTITGVDDAVDDGDIGYSIITAATSNDSIYNNFNVADVLVTNTDDDAAGITVSPLSGLTTTEAGGTQTFTVRLDSQPGAEVVIGITSSDPGEGSVSESSLTFTAENWNDPQTVTVTGVDDDVDDGDQAYTINTGQAASLDGNYSGRDPADVSVTNTDDDLAGFIIDPISGLTTTEGGGSDTFSVRLRSEPTANVTLGLTVSNPQEGSLDVTSIEFTPENWDQPQTVTVTGEDDDIDDGSVAYSIQTLAAVSQDANYNELDPDDIAASNADDDVAGITVAPTSGLITSEGGDTASFEVVLTSQPTSMVTIGIASDDPGEGTPSTTSLVFDATNWDDPQTVTITGENDDLDDGDITYTIVTEAAVSSDSSYSDREVANVSVINTDNDAAGVLVAPTSGLTTSEAGDTATFMVQLTAEPTADVTITLVSSNEAEGTVSVPSVTFTPNDWDTPQTVVITGVDDATDDGDVAYVIQTSATQSDDPTFDDLDVDDVQVTNSDDDSVAIRVQPISGLITSEAGQMASFEISLGSQPAADVTIGLSSSNADEGTIDKNSVTFTPQDWNSPQTIVVTGVDDLVDDGDVAYVVVTEAAVSADDSYNDLDGPDVSVTNMDDDTAGVIIQPVAGLQTTESGGSASFTVVLASQPLAEVAINLASDDSTEGVVDTATVTFDADDWDTPQTVVVTGQDDVFDDGDIGYSIVTSATSNDLAYADLEVSDVSVTNIDDDVPGIAIVPTAGLVTSEQGGTATFDVVLTSQPTADVTITLTSSDPDEGTVSLSQVVFSPDDFDIPQTVTVQGVDDDVVDGIASYVIETGEAQSDDAAFAGVNPSDVMITNLDDDVATLTVAAASAAEGTGDGQSMLVFDVTLSTAIAGSFEVDFATTDGTAVADDGDYVATTGTLSFDGNQGEVLSITVLVDQDSVVEGDETIQVLLSNLSGLPSELAERVTLPDSPTAGTIINDDTATISIMGPAPVLEGTSPSEDTALDFIILLSNDVQDGLSLAYTTDDGTATLADGDYTDNDGTLTFSGNAGETRLIRVLVDADDRVEPDETLSVMLGSLSDLPPTAADDISVADMPSQATILNDDFPQLLLTDVTANPAEGGGGATTQFVFEVTLTDDVLDADGFQVPYTVDDGTATVAGGDYTDNDGTLQFTGTAGETQTITVLVSDDAIVEGNETFSVNLGQLVGLAPGQSVLVPVDTLQATIENDDTANLTLVAEPVSQDEGNNYQITVTLSAAVQDGFTIDYATSDGSATLADGDYAQASDTLSFDGDVNETQSFTVQSQQDAKVELDEMFSLALQTLAGLPAAAATAITVAPPVDLTINNDDSAAITVSTPAPTNEGDGDDTNELVFEVVLSAPVEGGFSIGFQTADATATSPVDFAADSGTLVFAGDAETQSVRVQINADNVVEADETMQLVLGQLVDLLAGLEDDVVIQTAEATGVILNDDTATLSIVGPGTLDEGTGPTDTEFVFSVTLSAPVQDGLTVAYSTDEGTATLGDGDFQDNDGTLVFDGTEGETRTVTVAVTADARVELDETFSVSLGAISGLPATAQDDVTISDPTATATIGNDDFTRLLLTDITASTVEGSSDGATTEFQFSVTLTDAVDDADGFQVPVMINDGTARAGDGDYQDNDLTLQFDGTAMESHTVTVLVNHDIIVEGDETFTVQLGQIIGLDPGEMVIVDDDSLTATIEDDDSATLTLQTVETQVSEGDSATTDLVFEVSLSAPVQGGFDVAYTTNDAAATTGDGDYVDNDGALSFAGAAETQQIIVEVNGDEKVELDESLEVALGVISGLDAGVLERLTIAGSPVMATITNDDTATLTITSAGTVAEGNAAGSTTVFGFAVSLSHPIASSFSVAFETADGSATVADNDYVDNDASVTFSGVAETQTIQVLVNQDTRVEADETFSVTLGAISGLDPGLADLLTVDRDSVIATIENDDTASIGFVNGESAVLESGGQHSVAVRLEVSGGGTISQPLTINVVTLDSGTATSADFTLVTETITFPAGSTDGASQNVQLTLTQDNVSENPETIVLGLELASGTLPDIQLGTFDAHTVTVNDDELSAVLSGRVWVDTDDDGQLEVGEMTIPSVTIRLTGTSLSGDTIDRQTTTDASGMYRFTDLPAGTYTISQQQPEAFLDGQEMLGGVSGEPNGSIGENQFIGINLGSSQVGSGYHFGEVGLRAADAIRYRFLSRPRNGDLFGAPVTAAMLASDQSPEQSGGLPASAMDVGGSAEGEQLGEATKRSHVERDRVIQESDDLRVESIAEDLVNALSQFGG